MATETSAVQCPHGVVDDICVECSGVRYLGDLQRLKLEPGDILVLKSKESLSDETQARLAEYLKHIIPDVRVIVLQDAMDIGVLGKAE